MTKQVIIFFAILIGLFSLPKMTIACASMSGHTTETMACCEGGGKYTSLQQQTHDLNRSDAANFPKHMASDQQQCPNEGCHCLSLTNNLFLANDFSFIMPDYNQTKSRIFYPNPAIPVGFFSIWLPPKISYLFS